MKYLLLKKDIFHINQDSGKFAEIKKETDDSLNNLELSNLNEKGNQKEDEGDKKVVESNKNIKDEETFKPKINKRLNFTDAKNENLSKEQANNNLNNIMKYLSENLTSLSLSNNNLVDFEFNIIISNNNELN